MILSFRHKRRMKWKHFESPWRIEHYLEWISMRKLEYVKKKWFLVSIQNLVFFWFIKTSQHSFPFLPSWTTLEQWELLCLIFRIRNFLFVKIFSPWLSVTQNFQIIPQCTVLFRSIFSEIMQIHITNFKGISFWSNEVACPSRISGVQSVSSLGFFSVDEPRNEPMWFRRLSQNVYDNIDYRISGNLDMEMFNLVSTTLIFLQTLFLHSFRYLWHVCLPYQLVVSVFDFPHNFQVLQCLPS